MKAGFATAVIGLSMAASSGALIWTGRRVASEVTLEA